MYVEGRSDAEALASLWRTWKSELRDLGTGLALIPLGGKPKLLRKIGSLAAEKLHHNDRDIVVGMPDLYPTRDFVSGTYQHKTADELSKVQKRCVIKALKENYRVDRSRASELAHRRFLGSVLKHDLEMLLLAAKPQLCEVLGNSNVSGWVSPVEDQDDTRPPKRVVEDLFRTKSKTRKRYRETIDAVAVLERVNSPWHILFDKSGQEQCPVFREAMDWLGEKTGVPVYKPES